MATWEDLDNESQSDKDDVEDEANIAMGLVATIEDENELSDAESCTDSKNETEVYSKCNNPIFARFILLFIYVCLYVLMCD